MVLTHILAIAGGGSVLLLAGLNYVQMLSHIKFVSPDPAVNSKALRVCETCYKPTSISFAKCENCATPHAKHWTEFDGLAARTLLDGSEFGKTL